MLAKALRMEPGSIVKLMSGQDAVSTSVLLRVARLAGVGLDDLLAGK